MAAEEDGLTARGLRAQQVPPRVVYEALFLRLRAVGKKQLSDLTLRRDALHAAVADGLEAAARDAARHGAARVGEAHLLRALVDQDKVVAAACLAEHRVDTGELCEYALRHHDPDAGPAERRLPTVAEIVRRLRSRVVGQDHVVDALVPLLKRLRFNHARKNRPMGAFLFLGPSGTGKTEVAKALAECVYGDEQQIIFLEMGQFGSEHDKSMFIGAPPGYVGFGEGQLTNGLRDKQACVVLFDEVEKAHPSVFDVLLRFLDEGVLADPAGPMRDGRKCLLVLTSNIPLEALIRQAGGAGRAGAAGGTGGAEGPDGDGGETGWSPPPAPAAGGERGAGVSTFVQQAYRLDPHARRAAVHGALVRHRFFRPEFINRLDEIILFNGLGRDQYVTILRNQLAAESQRLAAEKGCEFDWDDDVVQFLAGQCAGRSDEGARVVGKVIDTDVIGPAIDHFSAEDPADESAANGGAGATGDGPPVRRRARARMSEGRVVIDRV